MADQHAYLDKLLCNPAFGIYNNIMATHLTNKATGQFFVMDNLGMMDVKTLNSVFSEYNKKACTNTPIFLEIQIQKFLALHRYVQGEFLRGKVFTDSSILPILSKIYQD